ncbi:MAG TPA: metal-dependent hydrolase [Oligoflexus sp.]|uniref:metal-dependent hydrolase n=1 Tax=Oligoflexus sp. TaxID=1971216 RepID=UPI002D7E4900|nr:metal-dependent hydrolase [Oligoflexus sp.]HET9238683.1 metal-dependent hydrolase [Oligoflexus sp.]
MHSMLTIHPVPVRAMNLPRLWYQNNPVKTHFFNALSTLFPQGENFFIASVRAFEHCARTPALQQQIRDFVTQEKNHAAIHKAYNRCLARAGYDVAWMEKLLHEKISFGQQHVPPLILLAVTVATEHITAVLGEKVLQGDLVPEGIDPELRKIWIWHALEEVDHKAVAMDLFQAAGGTYGQRARAMIYAACGLAWDTSIRMFHMLKRDGILWKWKTWWQLTELLFGRKGLVPLITRDILRFYAPGFHPARHDNYELVAHGRRLLGSEAAAGNFQ